jgi:ankyrin repeat protein
LFATCKDYWFNKDIRHSRKRIKIGHHKDPQTLLYFCISTNDIVSVQLLLERQDVTLSIDSRWLRLNLKQINIELCKLLINNSKILFSNNIILIIASYCGFVNTIESLLSNPKCDVSVYNNSPVINAIDCGHYGIIGLLLKHENFNGKVNIDNIFLRLIHQGYVDFVIYLLNMGIDPGLADNSGIIIASEKGHLKIVKILLRMRGVNPITKNNAAIRGAVKNNHINVVKLLLQDKNIDPDGGGYCLAYAAENSAIDIIKLLLAHKVIPGQRDLDCCIKNNNTEIAALFLQTNQNLYNTKTLKHAIKHNAVEIVSLLLKNKNVFADVNHNQRILITACKYSTAEIVMLLLQSGAWRVFNPYICYTSLTNAYTNNKTDVVELLLQNEHYDVNELLESAINNGDFKITKLLLKTGKVNPAVIKNNNNLWLLISHDFEILTLLLQDSRFDPSFKHIGLKLAFNENNTMLCKMLLRHEKYINLNIKTLLEIVPTNKKHLLYSIVDY